ncbi:MAG: restriction endonuclease [Syntrophorhabdaceae bacterium]|nr:restriction endonuclease [Syntrophorhabdaceae bacterium]MDD5243546.1 restriction endonuclease [Syntrophorhabdaceae bacterium]
MGRRSGFFTILAKEVARSQRQARMEQRRAIRYNARLEREQERARHLFEKEEKQRYIENRIAEVEENNQGLLEQIEDLNSILENTLSKDDTITFSSLRLRNQYQPFNPPKEVSTPTVAPSKDIYMSKVSAPTFFTKLIPGWKERHDASSKKAEQEYNTALKHYEQTEVERKKKLELLKNEYGGKKKAFLLDIEEKNKAIDEFESLYKSGSKEGVVDYNTMVLERSEYPDGCPQNFRITYAPESKELVIDYQLPASNTVPPVVEYKYNKTRDIIEEKPRKATDIKNLYQDIVSSITLRTIHEVIEADQGNHIDVVVFNGFVQTIDPATGKNIKPYLMSVRTTKENFKEIQLDKIDKKACLRNLGAQVSPQPSELVAVKPIIEFDMVDKRFIDQKDVLSEIDSRFNIMDLNPFEFENFVSNLFMKMGLETKLTRSSRDGGVDAVAFDVRPVLGGKVVIQAKRYKNVVGVSAVRDLYGTMMNEGANKGILVTTSNYGPDAYEFAKDKPIELIDGGGLLYLLDKVGISARIVFPED